MGRVYSEQMRETKCAIAHGKTHAAMLHGADAIMGAVGMFGGPVGAIASGLWFWGRTFIFTEDKILGSDQ